MQTTEIAADDMIEPQCCARQDQHTPEQKVTQQKTAKLAAPDRAATGTT
ncbi:MAG: hypothetical protein IT494_08545 [Gammaproteobacteria bacterium]|nr:hypothetical protein [Gammaproteobacteria bacterium]